MLFRSQVVKVVVHLLGSLQEHREVAIDQVLVVGQILGGGNVHLETVRRHIFDASTSPNFSDKCRDEILICFLKSGCATAFFKKSAFVFGIRMPH